MASNGNSLNNLELEHLLAVTAKVRNIADINYGNFSVIPVAFCTYTALLLRMSVALDRPLLDHRTT